jgi:hypothetical protein
MTWCEQNRVGYVFGLAGNQVLLARVAARAEDAALGRVRGEAEKVRRFGEFPYAAKTWSVERRVIARIEASPQGSDSRFIVTNLKGAPRWLYESVYCQRGQAENLIKAHKLHLASDRLAARLGRGAPTPLRRPILHQRRRQSVPPADPHRRLLAPAHAPQPGAQDLVLARRPVRHPPSRPDQSRRPGHRAEHPDQGRAADLLSLPAELGTARRSGRQAAALSPGAACLA